VRGAIRKVSALCDATGWRLLIACAPHSNRDKRLGQIIRPDLFGRGPQFGRRPTVMDGDDLTLSV
jgi:hypothetical protein